MKLAVMMAAWNAEAYVRAALDSVLTQAVPGVQLDVIVIDDGSTDGTPQVLREVTAAAPAVRVIRTANQGVTRARNEALRAVAKGTTFVTFLDADDLVPPGRYIKDVAALTADPALELTYGNTVVFRAAVPSEGGPVPGDKTALGRTVQLAAGMYRYDLVRRVGEFDTAFTQAEDMDFLLRVLELSPKYAIRDEVCLYYRRHAANLTRETADLRRGFAKALLYSVRRRKAGGLPQLPPGLFDGAAFAEASAW